MHRIIRLICNLSENVVASLVCYLYHAVSYDGVTVHVAFLEFLHDDIVTGFLIIHMHHCIVKIRIELLSYRLNLFYPDRLKTRDQLAVYLFPFPVRTALPSALRIRLRVPAQNCPPSAESFLPRF